MQIEVIGLLVSFSEEKLMPEGERDLLLNTMPRLKPTLTPSHELNEAL